MKLQTKIIVITSLLVVSLGILTIGTINTVVANTMVDELNTQGTTLVDLSGNAIANALLNGDIVAVQEFLQYLKTSNPNILYAYALGAPGQIVIHTFADGFPSSLLESTVITNGHLTQRTHLSTEVGSVYDFGWRLTDKLDVELHVGLSQIGITQVLQRLTWIIFILTLIGMLIGVAASIAFGHLVTAPLVQLTAGVQRFGSGDLTETIPVSGQDELGDLARAFNQMAADLRGSITQLQESHASYRALIKAAGQVGEGIALIHDVAAHEGSFLFVNDEFCRLTGYDRAHLLNLNAAEVIHPSSIDDVYAVWRAVRDGESVALKHEMILLTRSRENIIVETSATIVSYEGKHALAWFTRDITERKAREAEIQRQNRELTAINAVSAIMNQHSADTGQMLQRALEQALIALKVPAGWITIAPENNPTYMAAIVGLLDPSDHLESHFPDCECGRVLTTKKPVVVKPQGKCLSLNIRTNSGAVVKQHASVPLIAGGRVIGALSAAATDPAHFGEENFRLMVLIATQLGVALENARLWNDLQEKERLRAQLLAKAIRAQEDERRRIARELHDEIGQSLNALIFGLKTAEITIENNTGEIQDVLRRLRVATSDAVRELQTVIYDLRPSLLDDLGLIPALRWYAETRLESQGVKVTWETHSDEKRFEPEVETALFRIAQEAITNAMRYAQASEIRITLQSDDSKIILAIHDNGDGFDLTSVLDNREKDGRGLGLLGMKERAELLAGTFFIASQPSEGTHIQVEIPLFPSERLTKALPSEPLSQHRGHWKDYGT